jgi:two-component system NtrC family sensor kinase
MQLPRGIARRITVLGWTVTLFALVVFALVIVPEQKREFELNLESKARGVAVSIRGVAAGAAVSEDYSAVVEQAMQVLSGDTAIDYVVMTKNDGFSIVVDRSNWKVETLDQSWRPSTRRASSSIGTPKLFGRRVFQYALPFDYSGIQWGWIHVGLSLDSYDASVWRTYKSTGLLTLLCGGLSLMVSLVYAARLVRPVHTLHAAVERVAQGDLNARAEVHSNDEIERLATAFNEMAQTILGRNQILESVAFAAKQFLSEGDRDTIIGGVLVKVGQASGAGRASLLKMCGEEGRLRLLVEREWQQSSERTQRADWADFPWDGSPANGWLEQLKHGTIVTVAPGELENSLRNLIDSRVRSTIFVPVVVAGEWWGIVSFDGFDREREWGDAEKDSLRAVADMLGVSIARARVRTELEEAKEGLERRVLERTRELQEEIAAKDRAHSELAAAQQQLIDLSRQAGMAEVATGVLHNVGNVLNSVNVSTTVAAGKISELRVDKLIGAIDLLNEHEEDLPAFLSTDPKGVRVIPYLTKLGKQLEQDRQVSLKELELVRDHVGHIKQIVATQQSLAKVSGVVEKASLASLVEHAIQIQAPALERHGIRLERAFEPLPDLHLDKHQILQILLNLLRNAKEAIKESHNLRKLIELRIYRASHERVRIEVQDSGVGLEREQLTRIFAHGFTTKRNGHGFGLHSGALAAKQMGGSLWAESEGHGLGATFILELPWLEILERRAG